MVMTTNTGKELHMQFDEFAALPPAEVAHQLAQRSPFGVAIPFNGTRRWYLDKFSKTPNDLLGPDYAIQVRLGMWDVIKLIFADGVNAVYTPVLGRAMLERGPQYMQFAIQAVGQLAEPEAREWYATNQVAVSFYGSLELLPAEMCQRLAEVSRESAREGVTRRLRYGVFADQQETEVIRRTVQLYQQLGQPPTPNQLIEDYYGDLAIPVNIWIGSDQPSVFDVPLAINDQTALYFLQFPTLYLDQPTWRRVLYDYLFVRGDEETLYPANVTAERHITGLGSRQDNFWRPSTL
jgi:hypothetical protein